MELVGEQATDFMEVESAIEQGKDHLNERLDEALVQTHARDHTKPRGRILKEGLESILKVDLESIMKEGLERQEAVKLSSKQG